MTALRTALLDLAHETMVARLRLPAARVAELISSASRPSQPWIEFAHTPHMPHVGTARTFMIAERCAQLRRGTLIFCLNDQLAPRDLTEARYMPLTLAGVSCANPPSLGIGKRDQKKSMAKLPAPSRDAVAGFMRRWNELEPKRASAITALSERAFHFDPAPADLASWLCRAMIGMLGISCIVIPTSCLPRADVIGAFPRLAEAGLLWSHCPACGYRLGRPDAAPPACPVCEADATSPDLVPDVAGRQVFMNNADLAVRICGREKPYQAAADGLTLTLLGSKPPERLRVSGGVKVVLNEDGPPLNAINTLQALTVIPDLAGRLADSLPEQDIVVGRQSQEHRL